MFTIISVLTVAIRSVLESGTARLDRYCPSSNLYDISSSRIVLLIAVVRTRQEQGPGVDVSPDMP